MTYTDCSSLKLPLDVTVHLSEKFKLALDKCPVPDTQCHRIVLGL